MADQADARRIALALPEAVEGGEPLAFSVRAGSKFKGFAWTWKERVEPRRPRVPNLEVLAVRVSNLEEKEALLSMGRPEIFTEPHYNGFPAVLVRLPQIEVEDLEDLLVDAWRCCAPPRLVRGFDSHTSSSSV